MRKTGYNGEALSSGVEGNTVGSRLFLKVDPVTTEKSGF